MNESDARNVVIKCIVSVNLKLVDGSVKILSSVRYVLGLKRNFISLGTLDKAGFNLYFWKKEP